MLAKINMVNINSRDKWTLKCYQNTYLCLFNLHVFKREERGGVVSLLQFGCPRATQETQLWLYWSKIQEIPHTHTERKRV